ncbi:MFS transporter [Paraburkholderia bonniea]|uniref:MFS transporter n=1 Tax=Paraburkholderia bonniea TaxID=2152891 RepID=UPI001290FFB8|nr:MFS transporter [Paraburkholderia bonniea]WJF92087.1 MFS transporter [Paraburkholderia bonniea]WJF95407.1 MFS transporter [Paraburkholderia bonniea]
MQQPSTPLLKTIVAIAIGNALEWFDSSIYAFFAVYIAGNFFPSANETTSLILTFGAFSASFVVRPLGGLVLGSYADRHGRRAALLVAVALMTAGTAIITVLPNYQSIGLAAPVGLFLARLIQGFSAGGEFGSSTSLLFEHATRHRGLHASWQFSTQAAGSLCAALFGFALTRWLSPGALMAWGWRLPFAFGLLLGPVGWYLRHTVRDAPDYLQARHTATPVREVLSTHKRLLVIVAGLLCASSSVAYLLQYMPTFAQRTLHLHATTGFAAAILSGAIGVFVTPLGGYLSDRFGVVRQMSVVASLWLLSAWPLFAYVTAHPGTTTLFVLVGWLGLLKALYSGGSPRLMSEIFPVSVRASGISLGYNLGVMLFGASAPALVVWLASATGLPSAPGLYLMLTATLSLGALAGLTVMRRRSGTGTRPPQSLPVT